MTAWKNKNTVLLLILILAIFAASAENTANTVIKADESSQISMVFSGKADAGRNQLNRNEVNVDSTYLKLHGIFVFCDTRFAYLSVNGAKQQVFTEGRKIVDGWRLKTVLPDRIIIRRNDSDVILRLESAGGELPVAKTLSYRPPPALPAHAAAEFRPPIEGIKKIQPNYFEIERALVRKELESGLILSQARIVPEKDGGFFVERIEDGSLMEAVGLHVGDIIQSVNEKPLNSVFDALDLLDQIETLGSLELNITRSGNPQHLYYHLQ